MIRRQTFKITDQEGIDAALATGNQVAALGIAVSEGYINIPIEDGREDSNAQLILEHNKLLGKDILSLELQGHNVRAIKHQMDWLEKYRSKKEVVENKKEWERCLKMMDEYKDILKLNEAECNRLQNEIDVRRARIAELKAL